MFNTCAQGDCSTLPTARRSAGPSSAVSKRSDRTRAASRRKGHSRRPSPAIPVPSDDAAAAKARADAASAACVPG